MKSLVERFNEHYVRYVAAADVPYNDKSVLDMYMTPIQSDQPRHVIIFWYGGSWQAGDKATYRFVADYLAHKTGALVIVPNYEKYPAVRYPDFIDEAWQVIQWIQQHAHEYGADPAQYSVIGHSSGAHTACSVALGHRKPVNIPLPINCVSVAGPNYEVGRSLWPVFNTTEKDYSTFPAYFAEHLTQPITTKFLLLHGLLDIVVSPTQLSAFRRSLQSTHIPVISKWTFSTHPGIIIGMGSPFAASRVYARQVVKFLGIKK